MDVLYTPNSSSLFLLVYYLFQACSQPLIQRLTKVNYQVIVVLSDKYKMSSGGQCLRWYYFKLIALQSYPSTLIIISNNENKLDSYIFASFFALLALSTSGILLALLILYFISTFLSALPNSFLLKSASVLFLILLNLLVLSFIFVLLTSRDLPVLCYGSALLLTLPNPPILSSISALLLV